jgi:addiction module HigA family antidote
MDAKRFATRAPSHPGAIFREISLPALNRSKSEIARLLGLSRETLYKVLREDQPVTRDLAARLGKLCGNGPAIWLRLQAEHDAWHAAQIDVTHIPTLNAVDESSEKNAA